jgi:hydrogenase expression/formation protein HypC
MCIGVPGEIMSIDEHEGLRMGTVDFGDVMRRVCLAYVPEAARGEHVIVHSGFAISRIDRATALWIRAALRTSLRERSPND